MFSFFSTFSTLLFLLAALMVLFTTNPVYGIFFLILAFTLISSFFILIGVDMLGLFIIILYVGAIAVLFLFVLMMLNVKTFEYYSSTLDYIYILICAGTYLGLDLLLFNSFQGSFESLSSTTSLMDTYNFNIPEQAASSDLVLLFGEVFFTFYFYHFLAIGLVLLLTMVGAIILTLSHKLSTKRQLIFVQVNRLPTSTVKLRK